MKVARRFPPVTLTVVAAAENLRGREPSSAIDREGSMDTIIRPRVGLTANKRPRREKEWSRKERKHVSSRVGPSESPRH